LIHIKSLDASESFFSFVTSAAIAGLGSIPLLAARLMAGRTEAEKRKPPHQPVTFGLFIKVY
jgi:hypothetical protein